MSRRSMNIFAVCGALVIVAAVMLVLFSPGMSANTAPVVLPEISYPALPGGEGTDSEIDTITKAEVTADTVQAVVATMERPESYYRTVSVRTIWDGGSSTVTADVYKAHETTRLIIDNGRQTKNIILTSTDIYIWYGSEKDCFHSDLGDSGGNRDYYADAFQMSASYETLLDLDMEEIIDAGYREYGGDYCVYATTRSPTFGYTETMYVSAENGLLTGAERYDGGLLIYEMTSGEVTVSEPESSVFELPDGTEVR